MPEASALIAAEDEAHYLKAVAAVGDTRRLAVMRPIYAANGIKLLEAGAALTSRTLERLIGHRLTAPVDENVAADGTVTVAGVVARARELLDAHPLVAHLVPAEENARVWARLSAAPLPESVLFRLTVAREKYGGLYDHSLLAAVVALSTGVRARLGDRELEMLATAALMHDFGMLHADPAQFAHDRPLDTAARRRLRAHPITGTVIAQRERQLNPAIGIAILQHHERLDGSGYPSAPPPDRITRMARILMLVEIVLAVVEHKPQLPQLKLSLILRANHRSFDRELAALLLAALPRVRCEDGAPAGDNRGAATRLANLLAAWNDLKAAEQPEPPEREVRDFVGARLARLRRFLTEAGIDPADEAAAAGLPGDDPAAQAEMNGLMAEALWQTREIAAEALLRFPALAIDADGPPAEWPPEGLRAWINQAAAPIERTTA